MKKRIIFQLVLCLFSSTSFFAQEYNKFDLNKYYTPDIVRNSLELSFSTADNYSSLRANVDSGNSNIYNWTLKPEFSRYKNTRNKVSNLYISGNTDGDIYNKFDERVTTNTNNSLNVNYNLAIYSKKHRFLKLAFNSNFQNNYFRLKQLPVELGKNYSEDNIFSIKPTIGLGFGRIESVRDARQAVYLLDELSKRSQLSKKLTDSEVFEFAQIISKVKNKRFLDARLRKIEEIVCVDSFLIKNKFITNQSSTYFTTLYDFWENGDLFERNSGQIIELNFSPGANLKKNEKVQNNINQLQTENEYFGQFNIIYSLQKQMRLDWQQSLSAGIAFTISDIYTSNSFIQNSILNSSFYKSEGIFNFRYSLNYFPSTRTRYSIWASHSNSMAFFNNIVINDVEQNNNIVFYTNSNLNASADYYFSPQLRISGNFGVGYNYNYAKNTNSTFNNFGIGAGVTINYSFF